MADLWWYLLGGVLAVAGLAVLAVFGAGWVDGPDTAVRDPYDDLAVARAAGVVPPDGSHENRSDVDAERWAAELMWLHESMPEAVALDQGDDLVAPPVIPGRDNP